MTQKTWNRLSFLEQMSNVDGEVRRLVEVHNNFNTGINETDYSEQYLDKIIKLIKMTIFDPKNASKGYRLIELNDEVEEIRRYMKDEVDGEYVLRYWDAFSKAIS